MDNRKFSQKYFFGRWLINRKSIMLFLIKQSSSIMNIKHNEFHIVRQFPYLKS